MQSSGELRAGGLQLSHFSSREVSGARLFLPIRLSFPFIHVPCPCSLKPGLSIISPFTKLEGGRCLEEGVSHRQEPPTHQDEVHRGHCHLSPGLCR